ncbi:MAG TPA: Rpp14/Pop5 family protein [Candidatus Thermoplasmatota archaeon]|nr:Rpp14/Pop5 family protein [Candidatus Thermoplasmatota archaeon]
MVKGQRRYRYIRFQIKPLGKSPLPTEAEFLQELREQARHLAHSELRDLGCWLVRFQSTFGIIKCHYQATETLKILLSSLHTIKFSTVEITPERTSGTIRGVTYKA